MGFFDDASELIDKGVSAAKGVVSNVALEQLGFVKSFVQMCYEGWQLGFHECNGGNASYLLTPEDRDTAQGFFYTSPSSWVPLEEPTPSMALQYLLITAAGSYLKNIKDSPATYAGIIHIDENGSAWRIVWGFRDGGFPTSEVSAHVAAQGARMIATGKVSRVIYHAHPVSVAALTSIMEPDTAKITNVLWKSLTESVIAFPQGIAVLPWMIPGSRELAEATAEQLATYPACIWELHGVLCSGPTPDAALGMAHAIDKAAHAALLARSATHGAAEELRTLSSQDIRAVATAYNLPLNEQLLGD